MRRRFKKRGPNESEATGNTGQKLSQDGPAPLSPSYGDTPLPITSIPDEPNTEGAEPQKLVVETQPENPAQPASTVAKAQKGEPKGYVVLTIGLPGSGKTTWYKRRGVVPLSSDLLRTILFDDITDQRYSGLVFSTLRSLLRARLIAKMPWNYVDATNLSAHERRQWVKMAKSFGYEVHAVFFDVPVEICLDRNSKRERRVAEDIIRKMADRLKPPAFQEGFNKITVVRAKQSATPAIADTPDNVEDTSTEA